MERWKKILDFGPRPVGSVAHDKVTEFIYTEMRKIADRVEKEEFVFEGWENQGDTFLVMESPEKRKLDSWLFLGSGRGSVGGNDSINSVKTGGELRWIGINYVWNMYGWDLYGVYSSTQEIQGYISGRTEGPALSQTLIEGNQELPHFIIGEEDNKSLKSLLRTQKVFVRGQAGCRSRNMKGTNVVVRLGKTDTEKKKILLCAHYDSMYNTVGAYDNWAGTAVLMELVKRYSSVQMNRELEFVFTDGEECRLAGAIYHAAQIQAEDYACVINIDGIGRGDEMEVWGGNEKFNQKVLGLLNKYENAPPYCLKWPPPPGSDHKPFYDRGIPVCMLTVNDQGIIHTPSDVYDVKIGKNMRMILGIVEYLIQYL